MREILRRLEVVQDDWQHFVPDADANGVQPATAPANVAQTPASAGGTAPPEAGDSIIVPLAELRANAGQWQAFKGRLGVSLKPADKVEDLAPELPRLSLVAVEFPNAGDGRGYTQARLLRERYKFAGEIRAIGAGVKRDLPFYMARSGIDAFELAPGEDFESAYRALRKFNVAYQPGIPHAPIQRQRFFA
jgi:uncharacterized protein (DUF934 family)